MWPRKRVALLFAVIALNGAPAVAQVQLQSRTLDPSMRTTAVFADTLNATSAEALHALATFSRQPTAEDRVSLEASGVRVLTPLQGTTYRVRVTKGLDARALRLPDLTVNLIELTPEDRVAPAIWRGEFEKYIITPPGEKPRNYVLNAGETLNVTVRFHRDVAEAESRSVLRRHALSYVRRGNLVWVAVVPRAALRSLAGEDVVQWIDAGPLPFLPENDKARTAIKVDAVQNFNVTTGQVQGVGGKGVQVGIFDFGFDETHGDFAGRVVRNDNIMAPHATHIAGIIAGSGALSTGLDSWGSTNSGTRFQWRGMAPLAQLIDANQANGADPAVYLDYIANLGMDLSNHSYPVNFDGDYGEPNQSRDEIIRGDATSNVSQVPGRLHVYSAGNGGQEPEFGGAQKGYFALTKQVKNGLVVGNWDLVSGKIDQTSSLGPAHDGRIKPDVVAPGRTVASSTANPMGGVKSTGFCTGTEATPNENCRRANGTFAPRQNFYRLGRGTSMASAATTGAVALVLEQYATTYAVNLDQSPPLPSTLRAVMIHTARDISVGTVWFSNPDGPVKPTPGPDFVTGWGLIDAQAAVKLVASRSLLEGMIAATCVSSTHMFTVPPGMTGPVRVTLAWDDVAGDAASGNTAPKLINDLDLVLIDPNGTTHLPWQLDQKIVDPAGNTITDALQQCGTQIAVQRRFVPAAGINDPIPSGGVPAAVRGRDHLNNVEVVDAPSVAGTWQAKVVGFKLDGAQKFSLIGARSPVVAPTHPAAVCIQYPWLCERVAVWQSLCKRFPAICETMITYPVKDRIHIRFDGPQQRVALPLDGICRYAISCPACGAGARCTEYDLEMKNTGAPLHLEVFAMDGRPVVRDNSSTLAKRLRFDARRGEKYVVVVSPVPGAKPGTDYELDLQVK
jgi:hypothetical protein